jgi:hypothetical protein
VLNVPVTNAGDLISRQAVLESLKTDYSLIMFDSYGNLTFAGERIIEAIKRVPSVEPEKCGDCISREAATDRFDLVQSDDLCMSYDDIMAFLSSLPSVEPERKTGKWIWDMHYGKYKCSECGCNPCYENDTDVYVINKYRYCRWCGCEMEGSE